MYTDTLITV